MNATLIAKNLSTSSHENEPLWSKLDLVVTSGDVIGLVGANGSGKSTLLCGPGPAWAQAEFAGHLHLRVREVVPLTRLNLGLRLGWKGLRDLPHAAQASQCR